MENWCGMVLPFHEETLYDIGRVVARLRKSTFHGLSYADFLEAFEAWTDNTVPNKIVLLFVMAEPDRRACPGARRPALPRAPRPETCVAQLVSPFARMAAYTWESIGMREQWGGEFTFIVFPNNWGVVAGRTGEGSPSEWSKGFLGGLYEVAIFPDGADLSHYDPDDTIGYCTQQDVVDIVNFVARLD